MFDNLKDTYDTYQKMDPNQRGSFATIEVFQYLALMVYYVCSAVVVWALGRRLIQASFAALKESKRA